MSKGKDISTMFTREERCYQSVTVWSVLTEKR